MKGCLLSMKSSSNSAFVYTTSPWKGNEVGRGGGQEVGRGGGGKGEMEGWGEGGGTERERARE
jgi:hypothetical protein